MSDTAAMTRVCELRPGAEFRCNQTWYRLLRLGSGSASVEKIGSGRAFTIKADPVADREERSFRGHDKRITIGLTAEVDEVRG